MDAALGCVVDVDGNEVKWKLHIKRFVTFGNQAAFFHIMSPRPALAKYRAGEPVVLPSSIGPWANLWHPMDILAFTAGRVFKLSDGSAPTDHRIESDFSDIKESKGWMHSSYWTHEKLPEVLMSLS